MARLQISEDMTLDKKMWRSSFLVLFIVHIQLVLSNICGLLPTFIRDPSSYPENRLKELYLENTKFSDFFPEGLTVHKNLEIIDISNSLLYGGIPFSLDRLTNLKFLRIANNKLNGSISSSIGQLSNLEELDVSNNLFTGIVSELHFAKLSKLKKLHLSKNLVLSLQRLDLGENKLKDAFPAWIGEKLQKLELLRLNSNQFYGAIPLELCQLSSLCWLNLAGNKLDGNIPLCFGNLSCMIPGSLVWPGYVFGQRVESFMKGRPLEYVGEQILLLRILDLSKNNLVGGIPEELTKLISLQSLNLSRNNLNGSIPKKLGNLKQLKSLDLCHNNLSGAILQSLASLNFLSYINLSYNNLSGPIPTGNQLQSLDDQSFYVGNPGLCGNLIKESCNEINGLFDHVNEQTPQGDDQDGEHISYKLWFYDGIGLGFCVGFLGVLYTLYATRSWRVAHFPMLCRFLLRKIVQYRNSATVTSHWEGLFTNQIFTSSK
uniref:Receptor-like protein 12 n=1 Tax=Nicotiana tabacum TaxID=4097 RepID=A0A1S3ZQN4_TOBAC|nr:PREDICTED: receptor-like protein 12 [Nicotiana tabacum]